jgi:DNA polymerase/3'-5' exonuclease PolX
MEPVKLAEPSALTELSIYTRVCPKGKVINPASGRCVDIKYLDKLNKDKPGPKLKVPKEPKLKVPKEPKVKVPKEPKVKVPKEPKVKVPKEKKPKEAKVPKGKKTKVVPLPLQVPSPSSSPPPSPLPSPKPVKNKKLIIDNLKILEEFETLNKQPFKARAYKKVIDALEIHEGSINTPDDIKSINGIGEGIHKKIVEFLVTGKMVSVDKALVDPKFDLQRKLSKLYGVGPVKLKELMGKVKSFDELLAKPEILNDKQRIGLKYYYDMLLRIPLTEGKKHYKIIDNVFKKTYTGIEFELVGSYRRKNSDMGDIDILIKHRDDLDISILVNKLTYSGYIIESLAKGKTKFMGLCKLSPELPARRIDILVADPSYYYFALLYFTGSYTFNIYMRRVALAKGLSLSEYGFKDKNGNKVDTSDTIKSEIDIFKYLDIPYVLPEKRENV